MTRQTRTVSLTPELEEFVSSCIDSGDYGDASAMVRTALELLRAQGGRGGEAAWPPAGGDCGAMIRARDWSGSSLGPSANWSPALKAAVAAIVNSPIAKVLMWGPDHVMLYNDGYIEIAGDKHPGALGGTVEGVWPEIWEFNRDILRRGFGGEVIAYRDQPMTLERHGAPENVVFDLFYTPIHDVDGRVGGVMCTVLDVTARKAAERALAASEAELRRIADALPLLVAFITRDHVYRFANHAYLDWFGRLPQDIVGRHVRDVVGEAFYTGRLPFFERALSGEAIVDQVTLPHRDGRGRRSELRYLPQTEDDGSVGGFHVIAIDMEDRIAREEALGDSNLRFRTAMDAVHGVLWTNSADGRMLGEQPGWAALTGQFFDEYQGYGWASAVHPDDSRPTIAAWEAAVATKSVFLFEHRVRHHSGAWRTFLIRGLPIFDEAGDIAEWVGVHTDITEQRAAEDALKAQAETLAAQVRHRERAEMQLRQLNENLEARVATEIEERRHAEAALIQAQKMETLGQLTGGVAHDFNNLLQVVSGNLDLLGKDIAGNERAERRVTNAMAGVSRGAKLASQLLAFGRRQPLAPKVVNVARLVEGMDEILRRAIGEAVDVQIVVCEKLWNTLIDPVQIETALLNLAINSRDAMSGVGRLTIELGNRQLDAAYARNHSEVVPGDYVMAAVSDTGSGIAPEIIDKVFEPFFSTKPETKGSGLGLSMVYGFVKQSGGHVNVYSEVGVGTTIRLYLPRAVEAETVEPRGPAAPVVGGAETVLVVEDDDQVRTTVVDLLQELGYSVLKAVDAASALIVVESGAEIDLLFTDVVMPGTLKSPELARLARQRLPGLAVLYTSGYTENSIVHGGKLDAGVELLSKPYTREELARKLRFVLDGRARQAKADPDVKRAAAEPAAVSPPETLVAGRRTVLLVEDDDLIRIGTAAMLERGGFLVVEARSAEEAMAALQTAPIDVLVSDVNLPGASGPELAERARRLRPAIGVVFATGDAGAVSAEDGSRAELLAKPYGDAALLAAVSQALSEAGVAEPKAATAGAE